MEKEGIVLGQIWPMAWHYWPSPMAKAARLAHNTGARPAVTAQRVPAVVRPTAIHRRVRWGAVAGKDLPARQGLEVGGSPWRRGDGEGQNMDARDDVSSTEAHSGGQRRAPTVPAAPGEGEEHEGGLHRCQGGWRQHFD
jgi:hypothetical protein